MNNVVFLFGVIYIFLIHGADSEPISCHEEVIGKPYDTVSIQCYYPIPPVANKYIRKFCCLKSSHSDRCQRTVVSTPDYTDSQFAGRITLEDTSDLQNGFFTVTITGLMKEDEGSYICGMGQQATIDKAIVKLTVVEDSVPTNNVDIVYTKPQGTAIFTCNDGGQDSTHRSFLRKITKTGYMDIIDSTGKTDAKYIGRVMADRQAKTFTVKMAQVQPTDTGYYICGSDDPAKSNELPNFDLRISDEADTLVGPRLLSTNQGGSITAQCYYNPKNNYKEKYWCKLQDGSCNPIIKTDGYVSEAYEGRVVIVDNATSGLMQVLMNRISPEDEGWYWCVQTDGKYDKTSSIQVRISGDNPPGLSGSTTVQAIAGTQAEISCSYTCNHKNAKKDWGRWTNLGYELMSNVRDSQNSQQVSCQTEQLVLTIPSVSQKDSGFYWCMVIYNGLYREHLSVKLTVEEPESDALDPKRRAIIPGDSRSVEVVEAPARPDDSGNKSAVTAAIVSVCVALLVACAVFIFFRLRRRKNSDLVSVGSYRTNISLSDLDSKIGKENPAVIDLQETDIGCAEGSPKIKKKGSREDLEHSCSLINPAGTPNEQVTE